MQEPKLSIILPALNPGSGLEPLIVDLERGLAERAIPHEILVVDDGSTPPLRLVGAHPTSRTIRLARNSGKGRAVYRGFKEATGEYLAFIDSDGEIAAESLFVLYGLVVAGHHDAVIASKRHPASSISSPSTRLLLSHLFQRFVKVLFHLSVDDTQTGLKIFHRQALQPILSSVQTRGYAFDVELVWFMTRAGFTDIVEGPVVITKNISSTISPTRAISTIFELIALRLRPMPKGVRESAQLMRSHRSRDGAP